MGTCGHLMVKVSYQLTSSPLWRARVPFRRFIGSPHLFVFTSVKPRVLLIKSNYMWTRY